MKFPPIVFLTLVLTAHAGNNVLLIIADDLGTDSLSLYNLTAGATPPTPNLNSLAAAGVRFSNAYACPVCSPTRACMMTGRLDFRTGVGEAVSAAAGNSLSAAELTLPEVISQNAVLGVQSASFGKWHLSAGTPVATASAPNTLGGWPHYAGSTGGVLTSYTSWSKSINGTISTNTTYATTDVVNDAAAWITARTTANQPWVAWVAFNAPHTPFHVPPTSLHGYGTNPATNLLKYRAAIQALDTELGRLLQAVNTASTDIIFIGDNGTPGQVIQNPYNSTHAKDTLYEGGIRVPLIIKGPSVQAGGRVSNALVHAVDIFSTVLELAAVPLPGNVALDSNSLKPILANTKDVDRTRLYCGHFDQSSTTTGGRALRDDRYKIIRFNNGADEFYDLIADPAETTNLLAGGVASLSISHLKFYHRLRFNLGGYSNTTAATPLDHSFSGGTFSLTVATNTSGTRTMWTSTDLDFWAPVEAAIQTTNGATTTFSAPAPLPEKSFFSVLSENP